MADAFWNKWTESNSVFAIPCGQSLSITSLEHCEILKINFNAFLVKYIYILSVYTNTVVPMRTRKSTNDKNFSFPKWESWSKPTETAGCLFSLWRYSGLGPNSFQPFIPLTLKALFLRLDWNCFCFNFIPISSFALWWNWRWFSPVLLEKRYLQPGDFEISPKSATIGHET